MTRAKAPNDLRFGGIRTASGYLFELTGGALCLDLANTLDDRPTGHPRELLGAYRDLLDWGLQAGAITAGQRDALRREAVRHPRAAARALGGAVTIREAIFEVFSAVARRRRVPVAALDALNRAIRRSSEGRRLEIEGTRGTWRWDVSARDLERVVWPAVWSAGELLSSAEADRVRQCAGSGCAWLFLDRSKSRSRRWCDMTVCGNRAKARRHRLKNKRHTPR